MKIVLISCGKDKRDYTCKASDLYCGKLFKMVLRYAKSLNADKIYILSAKHGLVDLDEYISPYDYSLCKQKKAIRQAWASMVVEQMKQHNISLENDEFIITTGEKYYEFLIPYMKHYTIPTKGLTIGWLRHFYSENTKISK